MAKSLGIRSRWSKYTELDELNNVRSVSYKA